MTVRTKLAAILLSLVILPMLIGIALLSSYVRDIVRDVRVYQVESIANLEKNKLEAFFAERKSDIELFQTSAAIKDNLPIAAKLFAHEDNPQYIKAQEAIKERLVATRTAYGYLDVMLTDTGGRIISVGNESHVSSELGKNLAVIDGKAFEGGRKGVYFSRLYKTADNRYAMLLTAPLQDSAGNFVGEAVFEIDAGRVFELVQDATGMGETGETYIGALSGDEAQFVNPFHPDRNRTIPASAFFGVKRAMPMQQALRGRGGAGEAVDYMGHDVVAAWRPIPSSRWGLVTKMDSSEAFAPVTKVKKFAFTLVLVIAFSCVFAAFLISRSITGPIRDLQKGTEIIGKGNLDHKVGRGGKDEIGQLSRAIDQMAGNLKLVTASRDELDAEISKRERSEEILRTSLRISEYAHGHSLDELITNTLDETEQLTGSRIGFFHFVEADQKTLRLQTWSTNTLKDMCTAEGKGSHYPIDKAGVWVEAVIQRRPVIHNDYESLPNRKGLPPGHAPVIRELVAPVIRSGQIMGIIGVGNKQVDYTGDDIEVVSQLADRAWDIILAKRAEELVALQARHAYLGADVGVALTRGDTLRAVLQGCTEAMVRHLDAALARIWTLGPDGGMLEMQASAGMYTHIDGPSSRIPMDADRKIAMIARSRAPHLTNSVIGDSLIIDQQWASEEGMVSFAGYPLVIEDRVIGVMAMFARKPLPEATMNALSSIADGISIGIERMRVDMSLRESEERFRLIINSAAEYAIIMLDPDGYVVSWNEGAERIKGYTASEIIGKHFSCFYTSEDVKDDKPETELRIAAAMGKFEDEGMRVRKDGSRFWADVVITALKDEAGNLRGFSKVTRDITERRKAEDEIKALNEELEQRVVKRTAELTATNKELEAFSYSVSHDLRAPLRHIHGFVELLVKNAGESLDEKSRRYLNTISVSASQMGNLIDDLLVFSRMGRAEMHKSKVDIEKLLHGVIRETLDEAKGRNITWNIGKLPPADGDPSMLRLVLVNLIANALKFTRKNDRAEVEVGAYPAVGGETIYFVRDNGVGFDMQYVDKLFGVFQRLHRAEEFEGTGIGLANVKRIISRHGGRVWAESAPGRGATIYFSLPVT